VWREKFQAHIMEARRGDEPLWLVKPQSFMNLSGHPLAEMMSFYKLGVGELVVIHDEIDLPFGSVRVKRGGGDGGHNGLKSITSCLGGPDYTRIRIGVGRPLTIPESPGAKMQVSDWVLGRFGSDEQAEMDRLLDTVSKALIELCDSGLKSAQNKFNA
jgi:PTH1 family peptidyl-tRNA hydrolase